MPTNQYGIDADVWNRMDEGTRSNIIRSQGGQMSASTPTVIPSATPTITPAPTPTTSPALISLRDAASKAGAEVGWSPEGGVTINNNPVNTTGLTNYGGKAPAGYSPNTYYGTQEQIDNLLSPYAYKSDSSVQGAADDYNKWASTSYASPYASQIEGLIKNILTRTFNYDSANDAQFQSASKELTRNVMESMNSRGILNSTVTENQVQQGVADLLPQYREIARQNFQDEGNMLMKQVDMLTGLDATAYNRYQDEGTRLANALDAVMKMDDNQYSKWKDAYTMRYQAQQDEIQASEKKIEADRQKVKDAWDRVSELGYVDNKSSITLGVPAGTLSKEAREAKTKREQELADQKTQLANQKALALYQHNLSQQLADYKNNSKADPSKLGTQDQVNGYYEFLNIYSGNGVSQKYTNNPYAAYQNLMSAKKDIVGIVGDKLYNKLITDVQDMMKNQKSYGEKGLTEQQQFSQQNTVFTKALSMKKDMIKGGYDQAAGEVVPDKPRYTNEEIASYIVKSGIDETALPDVLQQVFTIDELKAMKLWQDAPQ